MSVRGYDTEVAMGSSMLSCAEDDRGWDGDGLGLATLVVFMAEPLCDRTVIGRQYVDSSPPDFRIMTQRSA